MSEEGDKIHLRLAGVGIPMRDPGRAVRWAVRNIGKELECGMLAELHRSF